MVRLPWERLGEPSRPDSREEREESMEGDRAHNVGWMRVAYQRVMVDLYPTLREWDAWHVEYHRPPQVVREKERYSHSGHNVISP